MENNNQQDLSNNTERIYGRAFMRALATDWAITPEAYRQLLTIASRINADKAVEAYSAQRLEYTRTATIREGVAIIPIEGSIFRYANFFSYYCGGTTVEDIALDVQSAIDNPNVHACLFEINSPGGEVTGIAELGNRIFAARKKIPMTARIGGYGCSAAYWLASAAGDIACDETAQLGSIGVCTAYLDDRENLKMHGFEEIDIISSQSPYKNMPPTTDEGKARIQKRIDALAEIFVETVARNRDVSKSKVLKDFGQGDVLIGADAVEAKMADRLGSFEESLHLLAKTHNPQYLKNSSGATLNLPSELAFETGAENSAEEHQLSSEENIEMENKSNEPAASNTAKPAAAPQVEKTDGVSSADFEEMKQRAEAAEAAIESEKSKTEAAEKLAASTLLKTEMAAIAGDFAGDVAAKTDFLMDLAEKFGKDSAQLKAYVEDQKALAAQDESSKLFNEQGKTITAATETGSAEQELEQLAAARAEKDGITKEQAMSLVAGENPELYRRYTNGE